MEIKTGYLYHIKDKFFNVVNDENLMSNHDCGKKRPTYFTVKDKDILWFIPLSSKVEKYRKIVAKKVQKFGFCNTILIEKVFGNDAVILLQNAFPTLEKYIDHVHTINNKPAKLPEKLEKIILKNFRDLIKLKRQGNNLFFADVDKIKRQMLEELKKEK